MNLMSDPHRERATRVKPDPIDPRGRAYKVVDTDFHVLPEWSDLRKYMPEPFRGELTSYPLTGGDYSPKYAIGIEGTGQETHGRARTAADILRVIDEIAVETVILTPGFTRPQSMFHQAMVTATAAAYNDFLINEVLPASPPTAQPKSVVSACIRVSSASIPNLAATTSRSARPGTIRSSTLRSSTIS